MTPVCPYCRTPILEGDNRQDCSGCGTPHHADCYAENGGCTVFGCSRAPADEPKVTVSVPEAEQIVPAAPPIPAPVPVEARRPVVVCRPPSVLGLNDPLVLDAPSPFPPAASATAAFPTPPPPPTDTTAVPPPPPPPGLVVMPSGPDPAGPPLSLAEMYASYPRSKSRVTYVLLGIFLGVLGVHNFYAGYARKAATQLSISVLSLFYLSFVSWIWAIIEVCTVKQDSDGVEFS